MRVRIKVPVLRNMTRANSQTFRPDSWTDSVSGWVDRAHTLMVALTLKTWEV